MKKLSNLWLLAALVCGMSLGVSSCKSDDDNEMSEEEREQQLQTQQDKKDAAIAVLGQLASTSGATGDLLSQTFEPTIGTPDESDVNIQIVSINTMEAAAQRFADLVNADIDEQTPSYSWSNDLLGTMTYQKSTDGKSWATVDVDIKQVPHLRRIVFRSPEQADNNGKFNGRAYYRFGDVVRSNDFRKDQKYEYWVCVRPAFGPEGKEQSHWVCLGNLPEENIYSYTYTFNKDKLNEWDQTWYVPTGLGEDKTHMQNLAEMIYAMLYPTDWEKNIRDKNNKKLPMFNDFSKDRVDLHNAAFWKQVCANWDKEYDGLDLWHHIFGISKDDLKKQITNPNGGLRLLYNGYSWITKWNCTLWEASYKMGTGNQANLHNAKCESIKKSMEKINVDCREMAPQIDGYKEFFGDTNLRWCVRNRKGKYMTWSDFYDPKYKIPDVIDVYRYYKASDTNYEFYAKDPEVTDSTAVVK